VSEVEVDGRIPDGRTPVRDDRVGESHAEPESGSRERVERYDILTGLPRRTLFSAQAEDALRREPDSVAVLVIGVDRFKEINDTLGRRSADSVLREVGSRLSARFSSEALVARLGGDEFAVMCLQADDSAALAAASDFRRTMDSPIVVGGLDLNVEVSIGIARPEEGTDIDELLRRGDVALAHAKAHRGGVEIYSQQYDTFNLTRLALLAEVRGALTQGELVLHYQPKIDLATKRVTGAEALLRWEHPERGIVPPLEFIPVIERTALIDSVTHFVIDEALGQAQSWHELGLDLQVAVNLAARNLLDPELPQSVDRLLRQHDVPASQFVLEITESGVMADPTRAVQVLTELRSIGVGVSIDDFGTGHASLAYLARLPATELKIDRSFVSVACDDHRADAIVRASSDLAHHFGLTVVAEGIEDDATMEHLIRIGCGIGQGYRISRPLPAQEITARLISSGASASTGREAHATKGAQSSQKKLVSDEEHATSSSTQYTYSCAVTAMILGRVRRVGGEEAVARLIAAAGVEHTREYLEDVGNWVPYEEGIALWEAGEAITCDLNFARHVGEDAIKVVGGSATAAVLRSLGSPEEHIRRLNVSSKRWSNVAETQAIECRPGYAEIRVVPAPGTVRRRQQCEWTHGMLSTVPVLFGLAPARVEHSRCQTLGAPDCRYYMTWDPADASDSDSQKVAMLQSQLDSLSERLEGVFATAADLIETGDLDETLARIADRAAQQVRAPKYVLAVRPSPDGEIVCQRKGLDEREAHDVASRVLAGEQVPPHWCKATVRSRHREYGCLVAMYQEGGEFLPRERELLELYARYAATALDSATALLEARTNRDEAQLRHEEARALLALARRLASAGSTDEIATRLADAIPAVIDCDRVAVLLWDEEAGELVRRAVYSTSDEEMAVASFRPDGIPRLAAWLEQPDSEPYFLDLETTPIKEPLSEIGAVASVLVPISTSQRFLGTVHVSVCERAERLAPSPELRERLSGVVAHAVIALQNGQLVDDITHQARHDQLTGLANRLQFGERITEATSRDADKESPFALFYIDLDRFKPVNDEFGHEVGDNLLRAVAERLQNCGRPGDTVARLGGDEFAVIVEAIDDPHQLGPIAERFSEAFSEPFAIAGHKLVVRASIGRAVWPIDALDVEGLLREADATMYRVKRSRSAGDRSGSGAADRMQTSVS
jgi:diguanylate cyclase (GGDEF)-like protein